MIPAMGVLPGGEEGVEEHEGRESYLWVDLVGAGVAGGGLSTAALPCWRRAMAGDSALAGLGERGWVVEDQWEVGKRFRGPAWVEEGWREGSTLRRSFGRSSSSDRPGFDRFPPERGQQGTGTAGRG